MRGITGFYEQNSKSKSKIEREIPELGIPLFLAVAIEVIKLDIISWVVVNVIFTQTYLVLLLATFLSKNEIFGNQ
jgi:hypothetical protein